MLALILALSLFLHIADPINDGYGNSSLTPPSSIYYRSVNAIDITSFDLTNDSKLGFNIGFSDLSNPNDLKNGFSLPIVEVYFDDNFKQAKTSNLLPGSGMRLSENENWHYAFKFSGDFLRLYENTEAGIVDISKLHKIEISTDGNNIVVSTDIAKKRNLKAYVIAGNYSAFSATGWKEISKQASPWSYSSTSQTRPVVDLVAENSDMQTQAINSGIVPAVSSRASSQNLWRSIMILGLLLSFLGLIANLLATKRKPLEFENKKLADRVRAATMITEQDRIDDLEEDNEFFNNLDINISEYEKTMVVEKTSDIGLDIGLEELNLSETEVNTDLPTGSEENGKTETTKQIDSSEQNGQAQSSNNKKGKKINVHNFTDDKKVEQKISTSSELEDTSKKEDKLKNETKKSLRVVDTVSEEGKIYPKAEFDETKPHSRVKRDEEEIVFSLGDSFWDDFDKTRNINWKK